MLLLASLACVAAAQPKSLPVTRAQTDIRETLHGVNLSDPYRWLEDQEAPETRAWIAGQNAYSRSLIDPIPERAAIRQRLSELMASEQMSAPIVRNGRYFFARRNSGQNLSVL